MRSSSRQILIVFGVLGLVCVIAGCLPPPPLERKVFDDTGTLYLHELFGSAFRIGSDHGMIYILFLSLRLGLKAA